MTAEATSARWKHLGHGLVARLRKLPPSVPIAAAAGLTGWLLVVAWWALLPSARTIEIVIPEGSQQRIGLGEDIGLVDDELALRRGDTLVIVNDDRFVHQLGPLVAPPGQTVRDQVDIGYFEDAQLVCSIHPAGAIGVLPHSRPGLEATIIPTLVLSIPLALAAVVTTTIARRLETS